MKPERPHLWATIAGILLMLLTVGVAQFCHRSAGIGFYRYVHHRYVASRTINVGGSASERELSTTIDFLERQKTSEMGIVTKTISEGSPYLIWFSIHSPHSARWARIDSAELRFEDGSVQEIQLLPVSSQRLGDTEPFRSRGATPRDTSAAFRADDTLDLPTDSRVQMDVEYTVRMLDGTRFRGEMEATLEYEYVESVQFGVPLP